MRLFLTGGSGEIGQHLLEMINQYPHFSVVTFDRDKPALRRWYRRVAPKATYHFGKLSKKDTLPVLSGIDAVIHLAALIPPYADHNPGEAFQINVEGTSHLIRALEKEAPKAFFIYSSSISVYGDRLKDPYIRVTDPLAPSLGDAYARTKIEAETRLRASSLNWTILRLTAIMGVLNHKLSSLLFHMPLDTPLEIATPTDAARALLAAPFQMRSLNRKIFNLGGGKSCRTTYREFLDRSFEVLGLGKPHFPETAFAKGNFHCGYYADGDDLEEILSFRSHSLEDYYASLRAGVPMARYILTRIFRRVILRSMLRSSEF